MLELPLANGRQELLLEQLEGQGWIYKRRKAQHNGRYEQLHRCTRPVPRLAPGVEEEGVFLSGCRKRLDRAFLDEYYIANRGTSLTKSSRAKDAP